MTEPNVLIRILHALRMASLVELFAGLTRTFRRMLSPPVTLAYPNEKAG